MRLTAMIRRVLKQWKSQQRNVVSRASYGGTLMSPTVAAGWWQADATEQLRNYRSWVYAAVSAIAQEVAKQRPFLFRNLGQAEHEQLPLPHTHPLCRLLDRPNPWLTAWELWYLTIVHLELTGNCYWYLLTSDDGLPVELWVIPSPWVKIIPDRENFIGGYLVTSPHGTSEMIRAENIVHLKYPHPLDPHYGLSPLQANALTVDAHTELLHSRFQSFQVGPRPGILLQTEQMLSQQTLSRMEEQLTSKFAGRQNWHRPMVLEQGLKASPWMLSPAEMDYLNSARMTRDEILATFRVPAVITGIAENLGLGSDIWQGARIMFCEGTVQPKLDLLSQVLTRDLGGRFGPDVLVSFPDCSPRVAVQRRQDDEADARLGLRTVNEIRQSRGLKPLPDPRHDQILPTDSQRRVG